MDILSAAQSQTPVVLHASDLHIGAHMPETLARFTRLANSLLPQLIIFSGDLTDGGRAVEYQELAAYLQTFDAPIFIVPGNHDAPVDNMVTRIFQPFAQFDALPAFKNVYQSQAIDVGELRTAGPIQMRLDWSKGITNQRRTDQALRRFCHPKNNASTPQTLPYRILVGHHPIIDAPDVAVSGSVVGGLEALTRCEDFGVDMILSGHTHQSWFGHINGSKILLATAPTLSSPRIRGEGQGFHAYSIGQHDVTCNVWRWDTSDFALEATKIHLRTTKVQRSKEPTNL